MKSAFYIILVCALLSVGTTHSQDTVKPKKHGWHLLDHQRDGYRGISLSQAYELLKGRKATPVIVAVIDSGIDTMHEDLKSILWVNDKEIGGNGKDDDKNGYPDDIYGWNFCGAKTGENLDRNSHEIARVYHNWKSAFENKSNKDIPADQQFLYSQWKRADSLIERDYKEAKTSIGNATRFLTGLEESGKMICSVLSVSQFTVSQLNNPLITGRPATKRAADFWTTIFNQVPDTSITSTFVLEDIRKYKNNLDANIKRKEEPPIDLRGQLTKDNYTDINDRFYGNSNLKQGSGNHGTAVSGVIAATRNNNMGMEGIADNVRILAVRAVPGGDEHDKDVALAIRYAVDNGAKIINMSFGKPVSPYKHFVDDAVRYAQSKGVLLVHGSGNEGVDVSKQPFYPNPTFLDGKIASNYLTVGASGDESNGGIAATFSNYGNAVVDIFAPGVYIYTTATNNGYEAVDGTSFASPVVAGVAALLKSYFPSLTPEQLVQIICTSGTLIEVSVKVPGTTDQEVSFKTLSTTGRIVNAHEAVKLALAMEKK
ncbi:MAG: S8 family serine peptidase [Chitinophagaceae bacterium]|nr:S8 family serine peptidase [Chitinophagaceae bacterium]